MPKERFISYPGVVDDEDPSPIIGWAGWDHADRMTALGRLVERFGDDRAKRTPLLAGMRELLPWVVQWHGDDDRYGTPLGPMWTQHIEGLRVSSGLDEDDLTNWRPPKKRRAAKPRAARPRKPPVAPEAIEAAFDAVAADGQATRKALIEHLGESNAAVKKAADALVAAGVWRVVKKRPVTYQRATPPSPTPPEAAPA